MVLGSTTFHHILLPCIETLASRIWLLPILLVTTGDSESHLLILCWPFSNFSHSETEVSIHGTNSLTGFHVKRTSISPLEENVTMYKRQLNDRQQKAFPYITKLRGIYGFLIITLKTRSLLRLPKKKLESSKKTMSGASQKMYFFKYFHSLAGEDSDR